MFSRRPHAGAEDSAQESNYWLTVSDLMMGLLMVFALLLLAALYHYGTAVADARELADARAQITQRLKTAFEEHHLMVVVDSVTGDISFAEDERGGVLFAQNSYDLVPAAREQLSQVATVYSEVLLRDEEVRDRLEGIVIEGHTNLDGTYEHNLELSQNRALSVMRYFLEVIDPEIKEHFQQFVTAAGRSFSDPILCQEDRSYDYPCSTGSVDPERSRRIRVYFRLRDRELLERIHERLALEREAHSPTP